MFFYLLIQKACGVLKIGIPFLDVSANGTTFI
jgi:hypothetical protein